MLDGLAALQTLFSQGLPVVRVVVAHVLGSAPRELGATLLYWRDAQGISRLHGTVGGGRLEAQAVRVADELLSAPVAARRVERFSLAASFAQCCGGVVELYWERLTPATTGLSHLVPEGALPLWRYCALDGSAKEWLFHAAASVPACLPPVPQSAAALLTQEGQRYFVERVADHSVPVCLYGAGHVGRALVRVLTDLPFRITWIDSREQMLQEACALYPSHAIRAVWADGPADVVADVVADLPAGACHLVMTHSHDEDFAVCETLLQRNTFAFLGMIGSKAKAQRFRQRLLQRGCEPAALARWVCPIGLSSIESKTPAAVAVSVAAQLLQWYEATQVPVFSSPQGVTP